MFVFLFFLFLPAAAVQLAGADCQLDDENGKNQARHAMTDYVTYIVCASGSRLECLASLAEGLVNTESLGMRQDWHGV